jgi:ubiquinol-cytochrome c reductase cytochrome c subunit
MRGRLAAAAIPLLAVAASCSFDATPPEHFTESGGGTRTPEAIYAGDCAWCHGSEGQGTERGPDLDGELDGPAYTHFMLSTGRMPISRPHEGTAFHEDPAYTSEEIDGIVDYVSGFGGTGPEIPTPDPDAGDVGAGADLYFENCAACHSTTAVGGALDDGLVAPPLDRSTPVQVAEAMAVGPGCEPDNPTCGRGSGAMPSFDFSDEEVDAITAYVDYLQHPDERGGWGIGKIGPVSEGAVGWIIGLGLLLIVTRWIGTTVKKQ